MQVTVVNGRTVVNMTDAEADELHTRLGAMLDRRKQLIAMEHSMKNWSDVVSVKENISFSIHDPEA
jgi:hypothetical protein